MCDVIKFNFTILPRRRNDDLAAMIISRNMIFIVLINRTNTELELCECSVCISSESRSLKSVSILEASHLRCEGVGAVGAGRKDEVYTRKVQYFPFITQQSVFSFLNVEFSSTPNRTQHDRTETIEYFQAELCSALLFFVSFFTVLFSRYTHLTSLELCFLLALLLSFGLKKKNNNKKLVSFQKHTTRL